MNAPSPNENETPPRFRWSPLGWLLVGTVFVTLIAVQVDSTLAHRDHFWDQARSIDDPTSDAYSALHFEATLRHLAGRFETESDPARVLVMGNSAVATNVDLDRAGRCCGAHTLVSKATSNRLTMLEAAMVGPQLLELAPDLVVLSMNRWDAAHPDGWAHLRFYDPQVAWRIGQPIELVGHPTAHILGLLKRQSLVFRHWQALLQLISARAGLPLEAMLDTTANAPWMGEEVQQFPLPTVETRALRDLARQLSAAGTRLLLFSPPTRELVETSEGGESMSVPQQRQSRLEHHLAELAREEGFTFVPHTAFEGLTPEMFADSIHLTTSGSIELTRQLSPWMAHTLRAQRPNILLIDIDSLRSDRLTIAEDGSTVAPNIMSLAEHGVLFPRVTVPSGWTLPSFVSMLAGRSPPATLLATEAGSMLPSARAHLITTILSKRGYANGVAWGKTILSNHGHALSWFGGVDAEDLGDIGTYTQRVAQGMEEPFFHVLQDIDLHLTHKPWKGDGTLDPADRQESAERYLLDVRDAYDSQLRSYDVKVGKLLDALEAAGLRERTIIVVTSNHGEELGDHNLATIGHGKILFDSVLTVPMVISDPKTAAPGRVVASAVKLQDLAPTLLDLAGFPVPDVMTGISLAPTMEAGEQRPPSRDSFAMTFRRSAALRTERFKIILQPIGCLPEERLDLPPIQSPVCVHVYDLDEDPLEMRNIAEDDPERTASLQARLLQWVTTQFESAPVEHSARFQAAMQQQGYWQAASGTDESQTEVEFIRRTSQVTEVRVRVIPEVTRAGGAGATDPVACRVRFLVDTRGMPVSVEPVVCDASYVEAVLAAAAQWRFEPWQYEGQPKPFAVVKEIRFVPEP